MTAKFSVDEYLNMDLLEALGLTTLTPEERASFLASFGAVIQERLMLRLMKELNESQKDELETILTNRPNDAEALARFLAAEVPQFREIAGEEIAKYKKELLDRFEKKK